MKIKKTLTSLGLTLKPQGINQSFDDIYWAKSSTIKKQAFFIVGPNHFEDAAQEVFFKIHKNLHKFEGRSSLTTWVYQITLNTCLNYKRKLKKNLKDLDFDAHEPPSYDFEGSDPFKRELVFKAIEELSDKHKSTFILFFIMELKLTEIAEVLEVNEGTVKSRVHTAKEKVKKYLNDKGVSFE